MTPFEAITSVFVTWVEPLRYTLPPLTAILTEAPLRVLAYLPFSVTTVLAGTLPLTTW